MRIRLAAPCLVLLLIRTPPAAGADLDWPSYAGPPESTKYSPADQIDATNVQRLREAWTWDSIDNRTAKLGVFPACDAGWPEHRAGVYESTPIVVGGRLFVSTSFGQLAALDPATGAPRWKYLTDARLHFTKDGKADGYPPNLGFVHRGVAYWADAAGERGLVILGTADARLLAIDADKGRLRWQADLTEGLRRRVPRENYAVTSPPGICGDTVLVGASIRDLTERDRVPPGDVRGYDAATGRLKWTFHTIPVSGDGEAAPTWGNSSWQRAGGANVWTWFSVDTASGTAYLATGTPNRDLYGGHRPGDNLFAESLVAVDCETGAKRWHQQIVRHGVWDYDLPAPPVVTADRLYQVSKQAYLYVFDRATGAPSFAMPERPAPASPIASERLASRQRHPDRPAPFDAQGVDFARDLLDWGGLGAWAKKQIEPDRLPSPLEDGPLYTPPSLAGVVQRPGWRGGGSWAGAAYHPPENLVLVPSVSRPDVAMLRMEENGEVVRQLGVGIHPLTLKPQPFYGRITAYDATSGEIRWVVPIGNEPADAIRELLVNKMGRDAAQAQKTVDGEIAKLMKSPHVPAGAPPQIGSWRRIHLLATRSLLFAVQEGAVEVCGAARRDGEVTTLLYNAPPVDPILHVLDPATGATVHTMPLPGGLNASGAPMTYVAGDKQYVAMPVGGASEPARIVALGLPDAD